MALELDFGGGFLDHSTQASGSGFLKNWKKDGAIVVWIHPQAPIYSLWSHGWSRYSTEKDKETDQEVQVIRGMRVNCLEDEKLLKKQRWRNDNDERDVPPVICPHCRLVEHVRSLINEGELQWSDPIFRFETDETEEVIYAGAFCGLFQKRELTKKELAEVRKTGVKINEAFMQNGYCRQQYVFAVASESDVDAGWVIALEGQTLGDKLKKSIRDEIKRCGGDAQEGHPKFRPYPFEWTFDDNKDFSEKYDVVALSRQRPKGAIADLLAQEEHPSFDRLLAPPKLGSLKRSIEEAALIKFPLDEIFAPAIERYGEEYDDESETDEEETEEEAIEVESDEEETEEDDSDEEELEEEDLVDCDVCGAALMPTDMVCKECGAVYAEEGEGTIFLVSRKCGNPDCLETAVPVNEDGGGTCPQCGAVHTDDWSFKFPKVPKEKKAARKNTRSTSTKKAARKEPTAKHSDARQSRRSKARAVSSGHGKNS